MLSRGARGASGSTRSRRWSAAMNRAATAGLLRRARSSRDLAGVLGRDDGADRARRSRCSTLLQAWRAAGASRLDLNGDGKIDDPGAAIMDEAWPKIADAVMAPVLGPLVPKPRRSSQPSTTRRTRRARPTTAAGTATSTRTCGRCSASRSRPVRAPVLRGRRARRLPGLALGGARRGRERARGRAGRRPDAVARGRDGRADPLRGGLLPATMRWTNRPTFQQVISFASHRRR